MDRRLAEKHIKVRLDFPGKLIFSNFGLRSILHRMKGLGGYLNALAKLLNLLDYHEACAFFEIGHCVRILLSSLEYKIQHDPYRLFENPDYFSKLKEAQKSNAETSEGFCLVNNFLIMLESQPLRITETVKNFEALYFDTRPKLVVSEIEKLFWGDAKLRGLLVHCGNLENWIGSSFCLNFFAKLLKYEYNSLDADKFIAVYEKTNPTIIRQMQLDFYIRRTVSSDNPGLISLYYYLNSNAFSVNDPSEVLVEKEAIDEYDVWLWNKLKCGYLSKKPATRDRRLDSKSTADDEKEDLLLVSDRSLSEVKVTPTLIELSKALACGEIEYLLSQVSNYSSWELIASTEFTQEEGAYLLRAYNQGSKKFRLEVQLYGKGLKETAELLIDPHRHAVWSSILRTAVYKDDMLEVIQSLHTSKDRSKFIECIMERELEELYSLEGESLLVTEFSLDLPQSSLTNLKRLHVNAGVHKVSERSDAYGRKYIEYQAIWTVEEGYKSLPEYAVYESGELEEELRALGFD
eukprot:TRINITY_DN15164_c0_g3_i1.p1 TRINITY_DN15164_c0_g3~~TRINITY_DN15164_c0_g3_i1.p1  ORF type:complete len:519 (+),score=120.67 TRINITY_DN15164_c0_g3_i1:364-1920(+)